MDVCVCYHYRDQQLNPNTVLPPKKKQLQRTHLTKRPRGKCRHCLGLAQDEKGNQECWKLGDTLPTHHKSHLQNCPITFATV